MERKKIDKILIYLYYTLGFVALAGIIITIFYMNNKSLVYNLVDNRYRNEGEILIKIIVDLIEKAKNEKTKNKKH